MSRWVCNPLRSVTCPSPRLDDMKNYKQGQDLGSIYSFKKKPKIRARKITPVSKKTSPLPNCRIQAETSPCWSVEEEEEGIEKEQREKTPKEDRTGIIFTFDEDSDFEQNEIGNNSEKDMAQYGHSFQEHTELRPASFSEYTETALRMRIRHEMERFLSTDRPRKGRPLSGDVSPLLRRTVVNNTLNSRKTTVDSGFSDDCDCEEKIDESDLDCSTCDIGSSDDDCRDASSTATSSVSGGFYIYDKGCTRRRKITPIPKSLGPANKNIRKPAENHGGKSCISLEEEDFEDVENFNSDDDFVDMGIGAKPSSKSTSSSDETSNVLTPPHEDIYDGRTRSHSSGPETRENSDLTDNLLKPQIRRRKRAVTLIPAIGELEKCRDVRNQDIRTTPEAQNDDLPKRRSSSEGLRTDASSHISLNITSNPISKEQNPAIQVQVEYDGEQLEAKGGEGNSNNLEKETNEENTLNALGENYSNPKGATRRKLTPADIGHPTLALEKMKELREQMVDLHLEEDEEGSDPKTQSSLEA